jgi:hypothetical protein
MGSNQQVKQVEVEALWNGHEDFDRQRVSDMTGGVLWIVVPYTTTDLTRAALRHAGVCTDLEVHVCLVDLQVVPFPCSLNQPPINTKFSEWRLQDLFKESGLPGKAAVVYTRDWLEGFKKVLEPGSLVAIATKKRWWRTREDKLARTLIKAGHQVLLLPVVR